MPVPSIIRHPRLVLRAVRYRSLFALGWHEAYGDGRTYDDDPWSPRSEAYDTGRDLRRMRSDQYIVSAIEKVLY